MSATESQLKQDLRAARAVFTGPDTWTQGAPARDSEGVLISPWSKDACQWCLVGAVKKIVGSLDQSARYSECYRALAKHLPPGIDSIPLWQDDTARTFDEITQIIDRAIEVAQ